MGNILNPCSGNSFVSLVNARNTDVFVDKTEFIEKTNARLDKIKDKFIAVTRPRRFGKTVTAQMLLAYYSKAYEGQQIFDELKISKKDCFEEHLNKHDIIYVDMNSIEGRYKSYLNKSKKIQGVETLVNFLEYSVIKELRGQEKFAECFENNDIENTGLQEALSALNNDLNAKFIFIMDEWELIYREYRYDEQLQKSFIDLLRNLFKTPDGQACFSFVYLTGILPIKKYNSQSALNVFKEYNMLDPVPYEKYFGFTEEEVTEIVKMPQCKLTHRELKEWYEGYKLNGIDIYNPNSVASAVSDGKCKSYWSGTSSNEEAVRLINMDFDGIKEDIVKMIDGGEITFSSEDFQNDMVTIEEKDDVFSLLVCLGYLGCSEIEGDKNYKHAYVPNKEIKHALIRLVQKQDWYEKIETVRRSERLLKAMLELDGETAASIIQEIHNSPAVSLLAYNDEESLAYCVMTGLLWSALGKYVARREDQAGKGRADLVYVPTNAESPLILIEFKRDSSAEEAIAQIKNKEYFKRYSGQYHNIIIVGISYSSKTKEHQCLIEKLG